MFISETGLVVRYAETDQMGIVHHSNYPVWFEAGRTDFIRKMGLPYSKIEESGALLPLIELKCSYKGFARYEDVIMVRTMIKEYTGIRIIFRYEVYKVRGHASPSEGPGGGEFPASPITEGETVHVWTNRDMKPVNIKKFKPEIHELIARALYGG